MKSSILFDYDGVIVDSIEIFSRTVEIATGKLGYSTEFTARDMRSIKHMTIESISDYVKIQREQIPEFLEHMDRELHRAAPEVPIFPEIPRVLREISRLGEVGIVSATPAPIIENVLKNHSLDHFFPEIIGGDTPGSKTSKIKSLLADNGSSFGASCMIGDTISDVEQGNDAGVLTIAVSWGWHSVEWLRSANPDFVAGSAEELISLIRKTVNRLQVA